MNKCKYFKKIVLFLLFSFLLINCKNKINNSNNDCRYLYFSIKNKNLNKDSLSKYYFFNSNLFVNNSRVFNVNEFGEIVNDSLMFEKPNNKQLLPQILKLNNKSYYQHYSNSSENVIKFDSIVFFSQENKRQFSIVNYGLLLYLNHCNDSITNKTNYMEIVKDISFFIKLFKYNQVCNESKVDYFWSSSSSKGRFNIKVYNKNTFELFSNKESDIQDISLIIFEAFIRKINETNNFI